MVLNLTVYMLEMSFPYFISKTPVKFQYLDIFGKKIQFWPTFQCKSAIWVKSTIMTSFWRHTWNVHTFFCLYGKRRLIDSYTVPWYQISIQAFIFQVHRGLQPPLVTKPSISHKVDMPILTCIFFTFNWLTLTFEEHFGKFYPEVASCLFSRGKRKYAPLGMRLLWKYINYFLVYHLISHFLSYLQNYKKIWSSNFGFAIRNMGQTIWNAKWLQLDPFQFPCNIHIMLHLW